MNQQTRASGSVVAGFGGMLVVAIGSIGPWVTAPFTSVGGLDGDGKWTIILAALVAWLLYSRGSKAAGRISIICVIILIVGIYDAVHIHHVVARVTFGGTQLDHVGWGVYGVIAGAVVTLAAVFRGLPARA